MMQKLLLVNLQKRVTDFSKSNLFTFTTIEFLPIVLNGERLEKLLLYCQTRLGNH